MRSKFRPHAWKLALRNYPDQRAAQRLLDGLRLGVDICFAADGDRNSPRASSNLRMPTDRQREAEEFAEQEFQADAAAGRRAGPYKLSPFPQYRVSPVGVVTKKGSSKLRLIHHLSWPRNRRNARSINSDIKDLLCQLTSFDDAVLMLNGMGDLCDVWMFKVDVKSAYRCIPVRPQDWPLLGALWKGLLYFDMQLPFGLKSSCAIWECFATAAEWIVKDKTKLQQLIHYIDDFLGAKRGRLQADRALKQILEIFEILGIPVSKDKVEGPAREITFLGILIDLEHRQLRLNAAKLQECKELIASWQRKRVCKRRDLLSLAGWLFWATKVVRGGRTFLRRIIDAARSRTDEAPLRVEPSVRGDLSWWHRFLEQFNGVSMIPESAWTESWSGEYQLFTDASGLGFGARWGNKYLYGVWGEEQKRKVQRDSGLAITVLELCGIATAALTWGHLWTGKRLIVRCDNTGAVAALNSGFCRDRLLMELVREMWYCSCAHQFELRAVHVPGVSNVDADALSRGCVQEFLDRNPTADSSPTIPRLPRCLN